ncbi:DUF320 domain-containing protein [Streptomyces sp. JJ66]|uniref:chaplin n=1 Tax=Streptomyces sp. JJ66 TaxID=2803843 RepID=UPI001C58E0E1|nr:chaplin [Streptomyces sp. JJ66]MBW1602178.1 DUF320 domain-containing protein [Streptomyces sp. JJ66]
MRQVTRKGLITIVAAGGVLALTGGAAQADADADGAAANSPGVGSGNTIQVPVHVPVNICGNTVNVIGILNPAFGNRCENDGDHDHYGHHGHHGSSDRSGGGADADGVAANSPGVVSGNTIQAPIHVPVNACGNSVDVIGVLNPAFGNKCVNNGSPEKPDHEWPDHEKPDHEKPDHEKPDHEKPDHEKPDHEKPDHEKPEGEKPEGEKPEAPRVNQPEDKEHDAGKDNLTPAGDRSEPHGQLAETGASSLSTVLPVGVGMMLGGYVLYRRARVAAQR